MSQKSMALIFRLLLDGSGYFQGYILGYISLMDLVYL